MKCYRRKQGVRIDFLGYNSVKTGGDHMVRPIYPLINWPCKATHTTKNTITHTPSTHTHTPPVNASDPVVSLSSGAFLRLSLRKECKRHKCNMSKVAGSLFHPCRSTRRHKIDAQSDGIRRARCHICSQDRAQ